MVACPTYMLDGKMELTAEALHAQAEAHAERHGRKKPSLLKEQLELEKVRQPNGQYRYQLKPLQQKLSFDKGLFVVIRALKLLQQHNEGVIMVGLAGASGSGKTSFSRKIQDTIAGVTVVSMDMYNDGSRVIDGNFDDPRISDYNLLLENLRDLREGQSCQMPVYDFKTSSREGWKTLTVPASRIIIIEGIYALSEKLRPMLDLCVSVTGGVHLDLVKRVLRDIDRSGQQPDEIIQQISDTVYPMYKAFIEPDLNAAHLRIYNNFNPFSGFMNATYILKSMHQPSEQEILGVLQDNAVITEESETFDIYLLPPEEDPETCQSWLRMRNRDGRYSLMFEESVIDDPFIISPRISFEVSVRVLGGLMALGYTIGSIMKRTSRLYSDASVTVKLDHVEKLGRFVQVQGKDREDVARVGKALGLEGTYMPRSYIEQVQLQNLTDNFQQVDDDLKRRFAVDGESIIDDSFVIGSSPPGQLHILTGSMPNVKLGQTRWPLTRATSQPRPVPQPQAANGRNPRRSMPSMHVDIAASEALPGPGLLSEQLQTSAAPAWGFTAANGLPPLPVAKPNVAAAAAPGDPAAPWPPPLAPAAPSSTTLPPLAAVVAAPAAPARAMELAHLEGTAQKLVVAVETLREQQAASSGVMQSHLAALQSQQQSLHATLLQLSHGMDKLGDALSTSAGQLRSASRMASPEHRGGDRDMLFASTGGVVWPASSRMAWVILGGLCGAVGMLALISSRPRS